MAELNAIVELAGALALGVNAYVTLSGNAEPERMLAVWSLAVAALLVFLAGANIATS